MTTIDPNIVDTLLAQGLRERAADLGDEDWFYQQVLATIAVKPQRRRFRRWPAGFGRRTSLVLVAAVLASLLAVAAGVGAFLRSHPPPPVRPAVWNVTGTMIDGHALHTATLLADGTVLIAGVPRGPRMDHAELYDPGSRIMDCDRQLSAGRAAHTATLLPDGRVLVAGGIDEDGEPAAELYDPGTRSWTATASMIQPARGHTATLLTRRQGPRGRRHGRDQPPSCTTLEAETWTATAPMVNIAILPDGHAAARWHGTRRGRLRWRGQSVELRRSCMTRAQGRGRRSGR